MLNVSLISLTLTYSIHHIPLFSLSSPMHFSLSNSHLTKIAHTVIISYHPSTIDLNNLLIQNILTTFITCSSLPESPDGSTFTTCVSNSNSQFSFANVDSFVVLNAVLTMNSCTFTSCSTRNDLLPIIDIQNSQISMDKITAKSCFYTFAQILSPTNQSYVTSSTFDDCYSSFSISNGNFQFNSTTFTNYNKNHAANIQLESCLTVFISECSFDLSPEIFSIFASLTPTIKIVNSVFYNHTTIEIENSYMIMISCCFEQNESVSINNLENVAFYLSQFSIKCPFELPTPTVERDKRPFAILTMVVYITFFVALAITIIVFISCKIGYKETQQYNELHDDSQSKDEVSSVNLED